MNAWMSDEVQLSARAADALDSLCIVGHVGQVNVDLQAMAWLWFVLKEMPDSEAAFPRGKWATIQHLEAQLQAAAVERAREVVRERGER